MFLLTVSHDLARCFLIQNRSLLAQANGDELVSLSSVIAVVAAIAAVASVYFAYRTISQMKKDSSEAREIQAISVTLAQCPPLIDEIKKMSIDFRKRYDFKYRGEDKPKRDAELKDVNSVRELVKLFDLWERIALNVFVGNFSYVVVYLWVGYILDMHYRSFSRCIRQQRHRSRDIFDALETLVNRFNHLSACRFRIDSKTINRLRQRHVPDKVIQLLTELRTNKLRESERRKRRRLALENRKKAGRLTQAENIELESLYSEDRSDLAGTGFPNLYAFNAELQRYANERGISIEFYRPLIIDATSCPPLPIDEVSFDASDVNDLLRERLADMYRRIHGATGRVYPPGFDRADAISAEKVKELVGKHTQRYVVWEKPFENDLQFRGRIVAHIALERIRDSNFNLREIEFEQLRQEVEYDGASHLENQLADGVKLEYEYCIAIKELYCDSKRVQKLGIHPRELTRRLLRRAIETVEEGLAGYEKHWFLVTCVSDQAVRASLASPTDELDQELIARTIEELKVIQQVIRDEGGRRVCVLPCQAGNGESQVDAVVHLFSQSFNDDPP